MFYFENVVEGEFCKGSFLEFGKKSALKFF